MKRIRGEGRRRSLSKGGGRWRSSEEEEREEEGRDGEEEVEEEADHEEEGERMWRMRSVPVGGWAHHLPTPPCSARRRQLTIAGGGCC